MTHLSDYLYDECLLSPTLPLIGLERSVNRDRTFSLLSQSYLSIETVGQQLWWRAVVANTGFHILVFEWTNIGGQCP